MAIAKLFLENAMIREKYVVTPNYKYEKYWLHKLLSSQASYLSEKFKIFRDI